MNKYKILIAICVGISIGGALSVSIFFAKNRLHGHLPKGIKVAHIDLSLKNEAEALDILEKARAEFFKQNLTVTFLEDSRSIPLSELGIELFPEETLSAIKKINARDLGIFDLFSLPVKNESLAFITKIDYEKNRQSLEKYFKLKEKAPKPATFYFENGRKLSIKEGKRGLLVDEAGFVEQLKLKTRELKNLPLILGAVDSPPQITRQELESQQESIKKSLNHQVTFVDPIYSDNWKFKLSEHLDWVVFSEKKDLAKELPFLNNGNLAPAPLAINITIDEESLNQYLDKELSKWLDKPVSNVTISRDKKGQVVIGGTGNNGLKIQRKLFKKAIELAIANGVKEVKIPVTELQPSINISQELQDLGIRERIAIGHTSYYGSPPNRLHNIKAGAAKFNALLIAPDETFSFNQNLGPVDAATGFKKELVIKKEGTVPEFGGGICQVSTTMFRAALLGGLPIVERNQHSYAVSYYAQILGHGLDATIYLGGADLKFKNNTGHSILIQTYTDKDYELYIVFYGTKDGRSVELEGPYLSDYLNPGPTVYEKTTKLKPGQEKQAEKSHTGFKALWYRHLTDALGNKTTEIINTKYKPVQAKILVGTDVSVQP